MTTDGQTDRQTDSNRSKTAHTHTHVRTHKHAADNAAKRMMHSTYICMYAPPVQGMLMYVRLQDSLYMYCKKQCAYYTCMHGTVCVHMICNTQTEKKPGATLCKTRNIKSKCK